MTTDPTPTPDTAAPARFAVIGDWLVTETQVCNCAAPEFGEQTIHESFCGYEGVVPLVELDALLRSNTVRSGSGAAALTDNMVERGAASFVNHYDDLPNDVQEHWRGRSRQCLTAALGGRVVVDLPEPDGGTDPDGDCPAWRIVTGQVLAYAEAAPDGPTVQLDGQFYAVSPEQAERISTVLLAAAREARRLAEEDQR